MKKVKYLILFSLALLISSCIKDLGNYEYKSANEIMPVKISGLQDTTIVMGGELNLVPQLENLADESKYVYLWYAARSVTAGFLPKRDTLSLERNLSASIVMEVGEYNLVYEVRDPVRDVYVRDQVKLKVTASTINSGWYILKEVGDETDFDYVSKNENQLSENVLRTLGAFQEFSDGETLFGNQQLKGKPLKIIYQSGRYYHQVSASNGTSKMLTNQSVFHVLSDRDVKTFNANNLNLFKSGSEIFYDESTEVVPGNLEFIPNDLFLINAGKLHAIYGLTANAGKFSFIKTSTLSPNYELKGYMIGGIYGVLVFDKASSSFYQASATGAALAKMKEPAADKGLPSLSNMDYDLLKAVGRGVSTSTWSGYAVFKSKTNGEHFLAQISTMGDTSYPFSTFRPIKPTAGLLKADVVGMPQVASCVYFGIDNKLSYYLDAPDLENNEVLIHTFPVGEEVAYIANPLQETLLVITNSASGWKLYGFPIVGVTPDIEPSPEYVFSGTGKGKFVMYRN